MAVSSPEYDAARTAYYENAVWFEEQSAAKARAFVTACTRLIGLVARRSEHSSEVVEFDLRVLQNERQVAMDWVAINPDLGSGSGSKTANSGILYSTCDYWNP